MKALQHGKSRHGGEATARQKLSTKMEEVKVLGIINPRRDGAPGARYYFSARSAQPILVDIRSLQETLHGNPVYEASQGACSRHPVDMPNVNTRIKSTGFGPKKTLKGRDKAEVYVMLQKRWGGCQGQYLCPSGRHWPRTLFLFGTSEEGACAPHTLHGDITKTACYKALHASSRWEKTHTMRIIPKGN